MYFEFCPRTLIVVPKARKPLHLPQAPILYTYCNTTRPETVVFNWWPKTDQNAHILMLNYEFFLGGQYPRSPLWVWAVLPLSVSHPQPNSFGNCWLPVCEPNVHLSGCYSFGFTCVPGYVVISIVAAIAPTCGHMCVSHILLWLLIDIESNQLFRHSSNAQTVSCGINCQHSTPCFSCAPAKLTNNNRPSRIRSLVSGMWTEVTNWTGDIRGGLTTWYIGAKHKTKSGKNRRLTL